MSLLRPTQVHELEQIDLPGHAPAVLAGELADLRRVNRWLGGNRLTMRALVHLTRDLAPGSQLEILDVGTGGADIPEAIVAWAERRRLRPRVVATDVSAEMLELAASRAPRGVELVRADARSLPFPDGSFDVATCSLLLHHLATDDALAMLEEMRRVARRGVVVNDLVRSWLGFSAAWFLSRAFSRNPLTRNDAPLSIRRAYTRGEMKALATRAGLKRVEFFGFLFYRVALAAEVAA